MAFNRTGFNHIPFNVQTDMVKYLHVSALEEIDAVIGSALNFYPLGIGNERVTETTVGDSGIFIAATGSEVVSEAVAEGQMTVILYPHFEENVTEEIAIAAEIMPVASGTETVSEEIASGANLYLTLTAEEIIDANTALGSNIYPVTEGYELISESASLENIDTKTCVLTVTLRPSQVLIIDAENYNVLLNQQNAIEIQSGDWIDDLNRNTTDITISAASGSANLSATILYTERYL